MAPAVTIKAARHGTATSRGATSYCAAHIHAVVLICVSGSLISTRLIAVAAPCCSASNQRWKRTTVAVHHTNQATRLQIRGLVFFARNINKDRMPTMIELQVCSFEESMTRLKKMVYKKRIRIKDFLVDFDRLRTGTIYENHFISGLSIAGVDKNLSAQQIGTIVDHYRVQVTPSLTMIDWVAFVEDVDKIFTVKGLEKDPLLEIPMEPAELLDKTRYQTCKKTLAHDQERRLDVVLRDLTDKAAKRGVLVKPFFDDAARDPKSIRLANHVTGNQFKQILNMNLGFNVSAEDLDLLIDKYVDEDYGDMVNYAAFAAIIDPTEGHFDPYGLC